MSDETGAVKHGPFRNPDGTPSLKKVLGAFAAGMFFGICIFGIIKDPQTSTILGVLDRLGIFSGSLLGIKVLSGGVQAWANREHK